MFDHLVINKNMDNQGEKKKKVYFIGHFFCFFDLLYEHTKFFNGVGTAPFAIVLLL